MVWEKGPTQNQGETKNLSSALHRTVEGEGGRGGGEGTVAMKKQRGSFGFD